MSLEESVFASLGCRPASAPVSVASIAAELQCSIDDVLAAAANLEHREPGDDQLITVIRKLNDEGETEFYLSRQPLPLNDEPEDR